VTVVHPTQGVELFGNSLKHIVALPWLGCEEYSANIFAIFSTIEFLQRVSDKYRPTGSDQQEDLATLSYVQ